MHHFVTSNNLGGIGEAVFLSLLHRTFGENNVDNVSTKRAWQKKGIDFIVDDITYDVKFDLKAASTNNLAIETVSKRKDGKIIKQGWLYTTEADCIAYMLKDDPYWSMYFFTLPQLEELVEKFTDDRKEVYNYGYKSEVVLVPLTELANKPKLEVPIVGEPKDLALLEKVHSFFKEEINETSNNS